MKTTRARILLLALPIVTACGAAPTVYRSAELDAAGALVLTTTDGRRETPPLDRERGEELERQSGFDQPRIAPDGKTVGWLSLYPNCCTSYDIPREVVLYRDRRALLRLRGNGQAIFRWNFADGGRAVAFCQGPPHFSAYRHYELRRVADGALLAEAETGAGSAGGPLAPWAAALDCP